VLYRAEASGPSAGMWVSENVERLTGFPPARFTADPAFWASRLHPEDRETVFAGFNGVQENRPVTYEYRWQCADGTYRWFLDQAFLRPGHGESPPEYLGTWLDITHRKQLEAEAAARELRLGMALEAAGMVTWEWDIATRSVRYSEELRSLARGPAVERYCSLDTLLPEIHPDDRARLTTALAQTTTEGQPFACEYRVHMLDGTYRWILGQGKCVEVEGGRPIRVLGVSMDITERNRRNSWSAPSGISGFSSRRPTISMRGCDSVWTPRAKLPT
jgi:PAS domain S-box-containing protein